MVGAKERRAVAVPLGKAQSSSTKPAAKEDKRNNQTTTKKLHEFRKLRGTVCKEPLIANRWLAGRMAGGEEWC